MIPIRQDRSRAAPRGIIARQSGTGVIAGQRPGGPVAAGRAGRHRARDIVLRSKIASWPEVTPWIRAVAEPCRAGPGDGPRSASDPLQQRSEEHTSELQSRLHLVCRLLLEKKK